MNLWCYDDKTLIRSNWSYMYMNSDRINVKYIISVITRLFLLVEPICDCRLLIRCESQHLQRNVENPSKFREWILVHGMGRHLNTLPWPVIPSKKNSIFTQNICNRIYILCNRWWPRNETENTNAGTCSVSLLTKFCSHACLKR